VKQNTHQKNSNSDTHLPQGLVVVLVQYCHAKRGVRNKMRRQEQAGGLSRTHTRHQQKQASRQKQQKWKQRIYILQA
jgi:hypothetical protein